MNKFDPCHDSDHDANNNVVEPSTLHNYDSTLIIRNQYQSNNDIINGNEHIRGDSNSRSSKNVCMVGEMNKKDDNIIDHLGDKNSEKELVPLVDEAGGKKTHHFTFFLENDGSLVSDENNKETPCSCSSSSFSTTTTLYSSTSTDDNSSDGNDGAKNDYNVDGTLQKIMNIGRSPSKKVSEYAIARSRIAIEAANEALRRQTIKNACHRSSLDLDPSHYIITSVGRGSSVADAIHEKDQRLVWKQGYDIDKDGGSGEGAHKNHRKIDIIPTPKSDRQFSIAGIAEQAAAVGLLKQQHQRNKKEELHTSGNDLLDSNSDIKTTRSCDIGDKELIDGKERGEAVLCLVNDPGKDTVSEIFADSKQDHSTKSLLNSRLHPELQYYTNEEMYNFGADEEEISRTLFVSSQCAEKSNTRGKHEKNEPELDLPKEDADADEAKDPVSKIRHHSEIPLESVRNKSKPTVDVDVIVDCIIMDSISKMRTGVDERTILIGIEPGEQPQIGLDSNDDDNECPTDGQATKKGGQNHKDTQHANDSNSETLNKVFDSDGDTSTIASSMQDIGAATSVTTRMFVAFALALGRISWKLKRIRLKKVSEVDKE